MMVPGRVPVVPVAAVVAGAWPPPSMGIKMVTGLDAAEAAVTRGVLPEVLAVTVVGLSLLPHGSHAAPGYTCTSTCSTAPVL